MFPRRYCPFGISKRKQLILLKSLLPLLFFVIALFLIWSRAELVRRKFREQQHTQHTINWTVLTRLRTAARRENRDEFGDLVLQEVKFHEVDLHARKSNQREYYDEAIEADDAKVIPGLGENGEMAVVPKKYQAMANSSRKKEKFNRILNELISTTRSVPDSREPGCRKINYDLESLPTMSIITVFKNEPYTSLIRMLHGIFERTPNRILLEIILVDDFSSNRDLMGKLERYLAVRLPVQKIKLVRLHRQSGLIRARMIGAHLAAGEVLVFLDAHVEVNEQWAEPMLQRIKEDKTVVTCPVIDIIHEETLEYKYSKTFKFLSGGFKWSGHFDWIPIQEKEERRRKHLYQPATTPTMAGGLFGIDRKYFWKMGSYDPGMKVWGGENMEMSFRIWQCGGSIETIPCSRVGHLFRSHRPYDFLVEDKTNNFARVAEVWLDGYKNLMIKNQYFKVTNLGDVSRRKVFRTRNKCRGFQWYLDTVYPEKFKMEHDSVHYGQVKNPMSNHCLDHWGKEEDWGNHTLAVYNCSQTFYLSQEHFFSKTGQLRKENYCAKPLSDDVIQMIWCESLELIDSSFEWEYSLQNKRLLNKEENKCLAVVPKNDIKDPGTRYQLIMQRCTDGAENQKWVFLPGEPNHPIPTD